MIIFTFICVMHSESYQKHLIYYKNIVAVLTYHHIALEESAYTISPQSFSNHLRALKNNHYNVISIEQFVGFLQGKANIPANAVVITFDDGYESFYQYAYPELMKQHMTATNFIIVGYIDNPFIHKPSTLNWKQISEMKKNGFSFYSHTYNTHSFVIDKNGKEVSALTNHLYKKSEQRLANDEEYKQRILNDLSKADDILGEKLGNNLTLLCFPYGIYNKEVIDIGEKVGISYFFTGKEGFNARETTKEIKRINVGSQGITSDILLKKLKIPEM